MLIPKWLFLAFVFFNNCNAEETKLNFFSHPEIVASSDVLEKLNSKSLDMCWQFGETNFFHFVTKKDEVYFEILLESMPQTYDNGLKGLFVKEKDHYIFSYEWKKDEPPIINKPRQHEKERSSNHLAYLVEERRIVENSCPQTLSAEDIVSIICNNNIIFYTGAGLSIASGVPSMNQLNDLLGLQVGTGFIDSLAFPLKHPARFVEKLEIFHQACFFSPPTEAHQALKALALFKNTKIVTENLDCLHEYSGILPYRINPEQLRNEGVDSQLGEIDYVICIGLSYDDRGFLGWYKRHHPKGKIIAIDLGNPSYLGDEDFIIKDDLQQLLPSLVNKILKNH